MDQGLINVAHVWFQPSWIVRTGEPLQGLTSAMQNALTQVDPNLPFSGFHSMEDLLLENLAYQRVEGWPSWVRSQDWHCCIGGWGVRLGFESGSAAHARDRHSHGTRISTRQAMLDVGSAGATAALVGVAFGLALAFVVMRFLRSELYGVREHDPLTLTFAPIILIGISLIASHLPTLRIARIEPSRTLRME